MSESVYVYLFSHVCKEVPTQSRVVDETTYVNPCSANIAHTANGARLDNRMDLSCGMLRGDFF